VRVALPCAADCGACSSATSCISCLAGFFLEASGACSASCPNRFVASTLTQSCQACPYDCLTCSGSGACLTCSAADFRTLNGPTSRCVPVTGYFDGGVALAVGCPAGCSSCSSLALCLSCQTSFFLSVDNLCYATCPSRTYTDAATRSCLACPYDCLSCDSAGACLTCSSAAFRVLKSTNSRCVPMAGFFENSSRIVEPCSTGCAQCASLTTCTACTTGFTLGSGVCASQCPARQYFSSSCQPCAYDCLYCNSTACFSCDATTDFRQLNLTSGRCDPLPGYFESNVAISTPCSAGCATCQSLALCLSCQPSNYMLNSRCVSACPARFFPNTASQACQGCPFDCLTCNSVGACLSCDSTTDHRQLNAGTGRCDPQTGYYQSAVVAQEEDFIAHSGVHER
jgi:proprotein convertase subtilisin/kexin type 5